MARGDSTDDSIFVERSPVAQPGRAFDRLSNSCAATGHILTVWEWLAKRPIATASNLHVARRCRGRAGFVRKTTGSSRPECKGEGRGRRCQVAFIDVAAGLGRAQRDRQLVVLAAASAGSPARLRSHPCRRLQFGVLAATGLRGLGRVAGEGWRALLRAILLSAPQDIRERLWKPKAEHCVAACSRLRNLEPTLLLQTLTTALRLLAKRWLTLAAEFMAFDATLETLTSVLASQLRAQFGIGPQTAAVLIATAGDKPALA